jgi:hypothetical protein
MRDRESTPILDAVRRQRGERVSTTDKPLAAPGLTSYRYKSRYGWIMIGATDEYDALREAGRSTEAALTRDDLQVWDGSAYVPLLPDPYRPKPTPDQLAAADEILAGRDPITLE